MRYADNSFVTNSGSPIHTLYSPVVDRDGNMSLKEAGFENTDEYIESFKESTDIRLILARVASGELTLDQRGAYGDFRNMPKTLAEVLQLQIDSANLFNRLPNEVKQKFNNDPNVFFAQSGSEEWFKMVEPALSDDAKKVLFSVNNPVSESEVVANES